jgi:urease accessory protein
MNAPASGWLRAHPTGWRASLALEFERRGARTVLARREHVGPLVVQKALYPEGERICHAVVVHPPGGIVQGDVMAIAVDAHAGAHATLTTPGATKWYGGAFPATQTLAIDVAPGAIVEWLPQETIVFDGAQAHLDATVRLSGDAVAVVLDIVCLGRRAAGAPFVHGSLRQRWTIARDGSTIWTDRTIITGDDAALHARAGWGGDDVYGVLAVAATVDAGWVEAARSVDVPPGLRTGVTCLPGLLLVRALGGRAETVRGWLAQVWSALRPRYASRDGRVPRLWLT